MPTPDIVLCAPVRTPIGSYGGSLKETPASALGAAVIRETLHRSGLAAQAVDTVVMGHVIQAGTRMNPARQAAIGGGLPVGAFGGRADVMALVAPDGPMYQAGTLSGNPVAMAAGDTALAALAESSVYDGLEMRAARLARGLEEAGEGRVSVAREGSLFSLFLVPSAPADYDAARAGDAAAFARFFHAMLDRGIYLPPSPFEAWFLTLAHGDAELDAALSAAREALPIALGAT